MVLRVCACSSNNAFECLTSRKVMGRVLTKKGHAVSFAEDGEEFLKVMENSPANAFDVVLIDRHMPKLDGPDATR